ncbi:MAG: SPASM domain-containing protein [Chloroflexaceae bacterium]|nr:SPASM domain-containing protein [Chloroflexaceae bacterium]
MTKEMRVSQDRTESTERTTDIRNSRCDCAPMFGPAALVAWLHLTDRCNLRCAYCYLPHAPFDMSRETGYQVIDALFRSAQIHRYQRVKLKYSGGETLLRFPLVVDLHRYAHDAAATHGIALDGVVLSNGTLLTQAMAQTMQQLGLRLMISLDGVGAAHDQQRLYVSGRGSCDDVLQGVDTAIACGITPDISVTVTDKNAAALPDLVTWILDRDLPFSLNIARKYGQSTKHASEQERDSHQEEAQIIAGMRAAYRVIENRLPQRSLVGSLIDHAHLAGEHHYPCVAGHDYVVFDPHGNIAACPMLVTQPLASIATNDPIAVIRATTAAFKNPDVDTKEECAACEWRYWCAGGCPLAAFEASGRYDACSPNCRIYRALLPEVLRLEQLRLARFAA